MEPTDIRGRMARACAQQGLPELRQTVRLGTWDEAVAAVRALPDDAMERLVRAALTEAEAEVMLPAFRMRGSWLTHQGPVTDAEARQAVDELALFALLIGCVPPTELLVVPTGAPRFRSDVALDPAWQREMADVSRFSRDNNPGIDCYITNAVVHDAHLSNRRAVRAFFANAALGAHVGQDNPWAVPWRLACRGLLLEAIYADGVAQVATRTL